MALIKCKECGAEVSSKAETCPKCGARVATKPMGCGTQLVLFFFGLIAISAFSSIFFSNTRTDATSQTKPLGSQWSYNQSVDKMSKGTIYDAWISSSNTVNFGFPYSGDQHATLELKIHPRFDKEIIFSIEKGQFLCSSYEGCFVLVRFDDEQATKYEGYGPTDYSTTTIFIRNYGLFLEKMLKAKRIRISSNIYQQGAPVFDFDVSGFDQNKYKPKN